MPRLKKSIYKRFRLKTVPKATFFASTRLISFVETKDAIYVLLSSKSARNPGHYRRFVSTGTRPGQMQKFRDCPGHSGTLGNYVVASGDARLRLLVVSGAIAQLLVQKKNKH